LGMEDCILSPFPADNIIIVGSNFSCIIRKYSLFV
jgi:hypothetical protein